MGAVAASGCSWCPLLPAPVECESLPGDEDVVAPDDEDLGLVKLSGVSGSGNGALGTTGLGDGDSLSI